MVQVCGLLISAHLPEGNRNNLQGKQDDAVWEDEHIQHF
jgi:hypothetical protein